MIILRIMQNELLPENHIKEYEKSRIYQVFLFLKTEIHMKKGCLWINIIY